MNKYLILNKIGEGSFSNVYKTKNTNNRKIYSSKIINLKLEDYKNIITEIHILSKGRSKYLLSLKDIILNSNKLHLITTYYKYGDLRNEIVYRNYNKKYFDEETVIKFFYQISSGVEYLHRNNIIHRDIKTSNILITNKYNLLLSDFNTCKILPKQDFINKNRHTQIGTLFYMSPELINNSKYDFTVDIWALGCVLYEIMVLKIAFDYNHLGKIMININSNKYKKIKSPFRYRDELTKFINILISKKRPCIYDILNDGLFNTFDKELSEDMDIDIIQNILIPKNIDDFNDIINKYYKEYCILDTKRYNKNNINVTNNLIIKKVDIISKTI
tara:strand:+ start:3375 stop:4364 length:990 start_codon:yes stop_codon:yes gene_type:complete